MRIKPPMMTVADKIAAGGNLDLADEFCPWAGVCRVTAYAEAKRGNLKITKIGRKPVVAGPDAIEWRDNRRAASQARAG